MLQALPALRVVPLDQQGPPVPQAPLVQLALPASLVPRGPLALQAMPEKTAVWDQPVQQGPLAPMESMVKWVRRVRPVQQVKWVRPVQQVQPGLLAHKVQRAQPGLLAPLVLLALPALPAMLVQPGWPVLLEIQGLLGLPVKPAQPALREKYQTIYLHLLSTCNIPFSKARLFQCSQMLRIQQGILFRPICSIFRLLLAIT